MITLLSTSLLANVCVLKLSFSMRRWWLGWHHILTEKLTLTLTDWSCCHQGSLLTEFFRATHWWCTDCCTVPALYTALYTVHTSEHNNLLHFLLSCQHIIHRPEQIHAMYFSSILVQLYVKVFQFSLEPGIYS